MEKKKRKKLFYNILLVIAGGVFLYSAFNLGVIFYQYYQQDSENERMEEVAKVPKNPEKEKFSVDWENLQKINPDIIGWILIPDTNISYALVQGSDNDYYLTHTAEKTSLYSGAIFMDAGANKEFSDRNTIIYGHNVLHGTMFAQLEKFKEKEFFDAHPYVYIFTPTKNYRSEVLSMYTTKDSSSTYTTQFASEEDFLSYIDTIKGQSDHASAFVAQAGNHIITLSTCSYEDSGKLSDLRYVLQAKLVEWSGDYMVNKE